MEIVGLIAGSGLLLWLGAVLGGPVGMLTVSPMVGTLMALAIMGGFSEARRKLKELTYSRMQGEHHMFRGVRVGVWEDGDGHHWVELAALRKLVPSFARDEVLKGLMPSGLQVPEGGKQVYVRVDEVLWMLERAQEMPTVRVRAWLRRDVLNRSPAAMQSGEAPMAKPSDRRPGG